ncbi:hypothetical protein CR205_12365 [Alteribacter lacisalsi]|uniref:CXXC-20-CXXC protein n=1 Tax=Alteribacter lacisalsi TaxID=2045244 RepID=A0A2W0HGG2_9BACI|nr:TIGR04104 family putative zinc finger protein [Alteribacter lacisalsi]PYZ96505.1 hypothetical protein CR205_12365 [Alteribacter lacisalsi]
MKLETCETCRHSFSWKQISHSLWSRNWKVTMITCRKCRAVHRLREESKFIALLPGAIVMIGATWLIVAEASLFAFILLIAGSMASSLVLPYFASYEKVDRAPFIE